MNNLSDVVQEKKNYTVVLVIILLFILVLGVWYVMDKQKGSGEVLVDENVEVPILNENTNDSNFANNENTNGLNPANNGILADVSGVLLSVDAESRELKVSLTTGDIKEGVIKIVPETVIQKLIVSKDTGESRSFEINLSDLKIGDNLSITLNNNSEEGNMFDNVLIISAVLETNNLEESYQEQANLLAPDADALVYVKGKVVSIDKNMITYVAYSFSELGTDKFSVLTQESTKYFTIKDFSRRNIDHTKIPADEAIIEIEDDVLIAVDKDVNPFQENTFAIEIIEIAN